MQTGLTQVLGAGKMRISSADVPDFHGHVTHYFLQRGRFRKACIFIESRSHKSTEVPHVHMWSQKDGAEKKEIGQKWSKRGKTTRYDPNRAESQNDQEFLYFWCPRII